MIRRLRHDPTWWFSLQIPFLRAPAACWWARAIVESTDTSQLIRPAASAKHCNAVTIWRHVCRLAATDETAHTPPTRTRTRPPRDARVLPPAPASVPRQLGRRLPRTPPLLPIPSGT